MWELIYPFLAEKHHIRVHHGLSLPPLVGICSRSRILEICTKLLTWAKYRRFLPLKDVAIFPRAPAADVNVPPSWRR